MQGHGREPKNLKEISLPMLDLRNEVAAHLEVKHLVPKTNIKAKIRTLLPKEN